MRPLPRPEETIVALATPPGVGALAVVRLSGAGAIEVADRLFRGRVSLLSAPDRRVELGRLVRPDDGGALDQVLATVMRGPHSYTGEDVVELSGHGGLFLGRSIVEALVSAGARPADPGEFTRRAFLNGRIDLAQAEAVADLIGARGERARRNALAQLDGGLSQRIASLRESLLSVLAPLEAFIDFGDDVPEAPGGERLMAAIGDVSAGIDRLLGAGERARLMGEGAVVALVGRPNVGKSSLLNALAGRERALVHESPGTTRDLVDVELELAGYPVRLVDTAGIRATPDPVESAGVDRARRALEQADQVVLVLDGSVPPVAADEEVAALAGGRPFIVVRNKIDLGEDPAAARFAGNLAAGGGIAVSARRGDGLSLLVERLNRRLLDAAGDEDGLTMTRARHYEALRRARAALDRGAAALRDGAYADMVAAELREALSALGDVTGESAGPDILDRIFSTFCIGK